MPFNITSPNTARFNVEFVDSFDAAYTPSSASITFTYFIGGVSNSSANDLTLSGGFWTLDWSSAGVDVPSDVDWSVVSSCSASPAQIGTLRIIDP